MIIKFKRVNAAVVLVFLFSVVFFTRDHTNWLALIGIVASTATIICTLFVKEGDTDGETED